MTLWTSAIVWLAIGEAGAHPNGHRVLLALAIASTIFAAADRHAAQLAAVVAVAYRAGLAARTLESRFISGNSPAEHRDRRG